MNKTFRKLPMLLAAAVMGITLAACSDDDKYQADVNLPAALTDGALLVEAGAHEFNIDIKTEGAWRVESQSRFMRVKKGEGTGNGTATIAVQNNQGQDRKAGTLLVTFPGHEDQNQTITVEQKYSGDYDDNGAGEIDTSNKIYAVGYSYDCTGEYASPNSVKLQVFDTQAMMDDDVLAVNATQMQLTTKTVTGSSISDVTNQLAATAKVEGGFGPFSAEAEASFNMETAQNSNYEYASTYFDLSVRRASMTKSLETIKDDYMTDDAWNDLNGVPVTNRRGVSKVNYPSTREGFKKLIQAYGTHVIVEAGLGGRLRRSLQMDVTQITSAYDAKAFAKASYDGIVTAEATVDEQFSSSYEENKKNLTITMTVLGGEEEKAKALGTEEGFTSENFDDWMYSVTASNMALVDFGSSSLVPLYELIERNATEDNGGFDGEARYQALKAYIEGDEIAADFSSYNCGTVTEFELPSFAEAQSTSSLVKDIIIDGQYVGQICNEYIPNIDRENRVTVVYPVVNNNPRYNMGFFLGNASHKPARVAWNSTTVAIEEYSDLDFGQVSKLYLRGASVMAKLPEGTTAKRASAVRDEYLEMSDHNYPLVKIFDNLWIREAYYSAIIPRYDLTQRTNGKLQYCQFFSRGEAMQPGLFPSGWRVPSHDDYQAMRDKLANNGFAEPGKAIAEGGVTGFELQRTGYYFYNDNQGLLWGERPTHHWTSDGWAVEFKEPNGFEIQNIDPEVRFCVRLVKK